MGHFQVLFSGEVVEGANPDVVRQNLARALRVDEQKLEQLFSGRTVVVRSALAQYEAEKLQARLAELGALSRIKDLTPKQSNPFLAEDTQRPSKDHTLKDLTAAHVACPRCGHMQLDAQFCARCGVDIAAAQVQQRKEDLIVEKKLRELRKGNTGKFAKVENTPRPAPGADPIIAERPKARGPRKPPSRLKRWLGRG